MRNHQIQLSDVVFSETFIAELGYSVESFANSVLKEGLPQYFPLSYILNKPSFRLMPLHSSHSTTLLKALVGNYFTIEDSGQEIPNQVSTLFMKNGYVMKIFTEEFLLKNLFKGERGDIQYSFADELRDQYFWDGRNVCPHSQGGTLLNPPQ